MALPKIASRDEWRTARKELLLKEKELSQARDALNAERRKLPMLKIDKEYVFDGPDGPRSLLDLFEGRRQLIVYHFMFDPSWDEGCPSCSFLADNIGHLAHLYARDTSLTLISRAPLQKLADYKERMDWTMPWYSSHANDFNYDFQVTIDREHGALEYNFQDVTERAGPESSELPGTSIFLHDGDSIYHTYSAYARGLDLLLGIYNFLDLTPLGRQEDWEEPSGRSDGPRQHWIRRHDQYEHTDTR